MLLELDLSCKSFKPLQYSNISEALGRSEKDLETVLVRSIGDLIFPQYLVFGNERAYQREADVFAVDEVGNLVIFELKVSGHYDRGKIYQALDYAQSFSRWQYAEMDQHYRRCFPKEKQELLKAFLEHFGFELDPSHYNRHQKIIVISNSSSENVFSISSYWKQKGIDIEEYFYRFYKMEEKVLFELSSELFIPNKAYHCWINTCERYIPGAYLDMIKHSKAAAFGDRCSLVGEWLKNAHIFLYLNGYGIIAAGKGTAKITDDEEKDERSIALKELIHGVDLDRGVVKKHVTAARIKELVGEELYFRNTIMPLSEEDASVLYKECEKVFQGSALTNR